jgi:hypothetical protein
MKLITLSFGAILAFLGFKAAQEFFSKNIILIADKEDIINEPEIEICKCNNEIVWIGTEL